MPMPMKMKMKSLVIAGICLYTATVLADGSGLIGWGKTMYDPTCAFSCRSIIQGCQLLCTPTDDSANHGTHHNPVATPPECFVSDTAFLRTMALCIDTYCPTTDAPPLSHIEDYWASHLGTGSIGDYAYVPVVSYTEALLGAREDEAMAGAGHNGNATINSTESHDRDHDMRRRRRQLWRRDHSHGVIEEEEEDSGIELLVEPPSSALAIIRAMEPLNVTSVVNAEDWQMEYNGMLDFENNENKHSTLTIVLTFVALFLPVVLSLIRFSPGLQRSRTWTYINARLNYPALWGKDHRTPSSAARLVGGGLVPTRGQALYIFVISFLNVIFLVAPYSVTHPQSIYGSLHEQSVGATGARAGSLAMGNLVAMVVFAGRNNVFLYLTNWSHGTFLLMHRWLGYWTIIQTVLHSVLFLARYVELGTYQDELAREYWIWGIVGTVAACAIWPASVLAVRQKAYEVFKLTHIVLVILFIVGYYYHIWYCFHYDWGYEIWIFAAGGIWGVEHVWRVGRMLGNGLRTAVVTSVDGTDGEYVRIEIEGVELHGVAYLCFPTLTWRAWETHPFSVLSTWAKDNVAVVPSSESDRDRDPGDAEKVGESSASAPAPALSTSSESCRARATFVTRIRTGMTSRIAARIASSSSSSSPIRLPVLIESYSSATNVAADLKHCTELLCIAGGVGITAALPHLHHFTTPRRVHLFWGVRKQLLIDTLGAELAQLPPSVDVETSVGRRLDIAAILREALLGGQRGLLGIIVCGPPSMADDVRSVATVLACENWLRRPFVFVDEGFSW